MVLLYVDNKLFRGNTFRYFNIYSHLNKSLFPRVLVCNTAISSIRPGTLFFFFFIFFPLSRVFIFLILCSRWCTLLGLSSCFCGRSRVLLTSLFLSLYQGGFFLCYLHCLSIFGFLNSSFFCCFLSSAFSFGFLCSFFFCLLNGLLLFNILLEFANMFCQILVDHSVCSFFLRI